MKEAAQEAQWPSRRQRLAVLLVAFAFVAATGWQVATKRDDWPLSAYKMYSGLQPKTAHRVALRGVSDTGEFPLESRHTFPFTGSRLRHVNQKLARKPEHQAGFMRRVQERYEAQRSAKGWPVWQGIRTYSERWTIRPGLAGIERPQRRWVSSYYLPPSPLLAALKAERAGAPPPEPRSVSPSDVLVELAEPGCNGDDGCSFFQDRYASQGSAARLKASDEHVASISAEVVLDEGSWSLFVRMRSDSAKSADEVSVWLDGARVGSVGNFAHALGGGAWVWASRKPGSKAHRLTVSHPGPHQLRFELEKGKLAVDQLWLSRSARELPTFNEPVQR